MSLFYVYLAGIIPSFLLFEWSDRQLPKSRLSIPTVVFMSITWPSFVLLILCQLVKK